MKRGEVWRINLDPTMGAEIKKSHPCVIVNRDSIGILPLKIIVPLTAWKDKFEGADWLIPIEKSGAKGIAMKSAADTFQVRSVSQLRLIEKLGVLPVQDLARIDAGLRLSLHLER